MPQVCGRSDTPLDVVAIDTLEHMFEHGQVSPAAATLTSEPSRATVLGAAAAHLGHAGDEARQSSHPDPSRAREPARRWAEAGCRLLGRALGDAAHGDALRSVGGRIVVRGRRGARVRHRGGGALRHRPRAARARAASGRPVAHRHGRHRRRHGSGRHAASQAGCGWRDRPPRRPPPAARHHHVRARHLAGQRGDAEPEPERMARHRLGPRAPHLARGHGDREHEDGRAAAQRPAVAAGRARAVQGV